MRGSTQLFTRPDAWSGGNIDALIFFGPSRLEKAIAAGMALWSAKNLDGPYRERSIELTLEFPKELVNGAIVEIVAANGDPHCSAGVFGEVPLAVDFVE